MKNWLLFHARNRVYDASQKVEWIDATMYDDEQTVDAYDPANLEKGLSTFHSPLELDFLDMIDRLKIKSVLDIGCGAGAFCHLLSHTHPHVAYTGYDASQAQISRAAERLGQRFEVHDVSTITTEEFSAFDAVHAYSVFSFMPVKQQLEIIQRILDSGAKLLMETGATIPDIQYAPRSCFKNFGKAMVGDKALMTVVSFPYRSELDKVVRNSGHSISYRETVYPNTRALNRTERWGGALANRKVVHAPVKRFEALAPYESKIKLLMGTVHPVEFPPKHDLDPAETYEEIKRRLAIKVS